VRNKEDSGKTGGNVQQILTLRLIAEKYSLLKIGRCVYKMHKIQALDSVWHDRLWADLHTVSRFLGG